MSSLHVDHNRKLGKGTVTEYKKVERRKWLVFDGSRHEEGGTVAIWCRSVRMPHPFISSIEPG